MLTLVDHMRTAAVRHCWHNHFTETELPGFMKGSMSLSLPSGVSWQERNREHGKIKCDT